MSKFNILFNLYSRCDRVFNSAKYLSIAEIDELELDIGSFMGYLRSNWPAESISPKLHMVEDHIVPFLKMWRVGCRFLGEQGAESLHASLNSMKLNYRGVRNEVKNLDYLMHNHLANTNPEARQLKVEKKARNLRRNGVQSSQGT